MEMSSDRMEEFRRVRLEEFVEGRNEMSFHGRIL